MKREVIIDTRNGKVTEESKNDLVSLKGDKFNEDSNFIENLCIVIKSDDIGEKEYPLKLGGYNFKLYLGSFCDESTEDILIYGESGGSGNYAIANIYHYDDGKLLEIFNSDTFSDKYKYKCRYLNDFKVELICDKLQKKYIIDISTIDKNNLSEIYDMDGKIITDSDPSVSYVNSIYPLVDLDYDTMKIEAYQRIIGITNSNTLGEVISTISLEECKTKVIEQFAATYGEDVSELSRGNDLKEDIISKLPDDIVLINLNKFGGRNGLIKADIDGDGNEEILCAYKYKDVQYLSAFREIDGIVKFLDNIDGTGYDISDLLIDKIKQKGGDSILVGWRIGGIWSVLDILDFKEGKFIKVLKGDKFNYSKIELCDSGNSRGGKNIALWSHETGEAYNVQIYTLRGEVLEKTYKDDKDYFLRVEDYYKNLINKSRETPQYLYYLIQAQCKAGKKKEAYDNINRALKNQNPFPSVQELKRLRKSISK
ncbi:Uncharacterised protein [uncultured Clostridium sp.]|uniref:hypothetical protein n=1 Tax=uncultured Clostridium sp. TaxID=59620 RepID=UPI00082338E7|nr:hypothetical protein [uncultured Clostridium sp.]SCI77192.1 Uncharacterised protein [uncultured Clostridium sp.]